MLPHLKYVCREHNSVSEPTCCVGATGLFWFGLVYLFIRSVTYVTFDTSITDYNLQHIL